MKIKKVSSLLSPLSKVLNIFSTSQEDTYSCDYINKLNEALKALSSFKFQVIYDIPDGAYDLNLNDYGYGIYLIQMETTQFGPSGIYVYRSNTDYTQNIGFNYTSSELPSASTRVSCNPEYPNLLQAHRSDGAWLKVVRVIKLFDL